MGRFSRGGFALLTAVVLSCVQPHAGGADGSPVVVTLTASPATVVLPAQACVIAHAADASGAPEVNAYVIFGFSKSPRGTWPNLHLSPTDANGNTTQCFTVTGTDIGEYDVYVSEVVTSNGLEPATSNTAVLTVTVPTPPRTGLVVSATASAGPVLVGDQYTLDLAVSNQSGLTAAGYRLFVNAPLGSVVGATTSRGSCTGVLVCDFGTLAPGDTAAAEVRLQATSAGTITIPISWNGANAPPRPIISTYGTTATVTVSARVADLALTAVPARTTAVPLRPFKAALRVVNNGPDPVNDAVLSLIAPARWLRLQLPAACIQTAAGTACHLRPLASGASQTIVVTLTSQRAGRAALIATVSSATATDAQRQNGARALVVTSATNPRSTHK